MAYTIKNKGPRMEPQGTPQVREDAFPMITEKAMFD